MYSQELFRQKLESWLKQQEANSRARTWINIGHVHDNLSDEPSPIVHVYLRKSIRLISEVSCDSITTLDIANIVISPKYRHKGIFKGIVDVCHTFAQEYQYLLYIESVISPEIRSYCNSRGWVHHAYHTSYYFPRV